MQKAFTIIEILVVVFLITIISAVSIPVIISYKPDFELNGAANTLMSDIRYVQQRTITEQIPYCLNLLILERKYQAKECQGEEVVFERSLSNTITNFLQSGFSNDEIEFNPYGAAREGGEITLQNSKGNQKIIEVRPSGFVKIYENN